MKDERPFEPIKEFQESAKPQNGILIQSRLVGEKGYFLQEFQSFQTFMSYQSRYFNLTPAGEFYFNLEQSGFTGISRFEAGHICLKTTPGENAIDLSIFLSHAVPGNILISREIYHRIIKFFKCSVVVDSFTDQ